jgi:D-3-phosphoglycerate dehydrogenase / 2-oxoglutarate reductase
MRVLVADKLSEDGVSELERHFEVDVRTGLSKPALIEAIGDYEAVVVRSSTTIDADVIAAATRLRVIGRAGIGLDNVDVPAATAKGVIVCNAPQSNVVSAAEHTVALLLALARDIPRAHQVLTHGEWNRSGHTGVELYGKTLGVVGLGRVGALVAQRCSSFGMHLVAYDPFVSPQRAARMGAQLVDSVPELCEVADIVTVHLPKTSETVGIIGEAELATLKPTALVVNTSRGGIIDEKALYKALTSGEIAGAALDVFEEEPTTESPLFGLDNVVVTPHLGASTSEAQTKAGVMIAEAIQLALAGEFVPSAVNVQVASGIPEPVKPFMPLAEKLGRIFTSLHAGHSVDLTIEYRGKLADEDTQALNLSTLRGILTDVSGEPVTFVNAPIIADERGIKVSTLSSKDTQDYVSLVRLSSGDVHVAGTLVGASNKERLVEVWGFGIDMEPSDHMVFFRYSDRPGIVGLIGGKLGDADVNIATMQVGRRSVGGEALIAMSVDSAIPDDVVADIAQSIGAGDFRQINLEA